MIQDPYPVKSIIPKNYMDLPLRDAIPLPEDTYRTPEVRPLSNPHRYGATDILDNALDRYRSLCDRYNLPYGRPRPIRQQDEYERPYYTRNWHSDHIGESFHRPIDRHR